MKSGPESFHDDDENVLLFLLHPTIHQKLSFGVILLINEQPYNITANQC